MQWWDNLWLNEGFATWMESKAVRDWQPTWGLDEDEAEVLNGTMNYDAGATTRSIRSRAETPDEINEQFDGLSYGKAGAVLSMVEHYLGPEVFRQGVHNYLAAHEFANATGEDFWNAQTANSGKPVDKIMESLIAQQGVPLLTFAGSNSGAVNVTQSRFYLSPKDQNTAQSWTLPVCVKGGTCQVISGASAGVSAPAGAYLNGDDRGYYRSNYDPSMLKTIIASAETNLSAPERIGLLGDRWALTRAGQGSVGDYLSLVGTIRADNNAAVLQTALGAVSSIRERIANQDQRKQLNAVLVREFGPVYQSIGPAKKGESEGVIARRASLFGLLGYAGDPAVVTEAKSITQRYLTKNRAVDPALANAAVGVSASYGDAALYDQLQHFFETSTNPQQKSAALNDLALFTDPALVTRTMDYASNGKVRNQDSWVLYSIELSQHENRPAAWAYIKNNWDKVQAQFTASSGGRVVAATGNFCSPADREDVARFFAGHKVASSERALRNALEQIDACSALQQRQQPLLAEWLATAPK